MNQTDLMKSMRELGLNKPLAGNVLAALAQQVAAALKRGERVVLPGIGTFQVKQRAARMGRNPKTGEAIQIPAKKVVQFKPAGPLLSKLEE
jgi:DNA-binding protein HU-beta